MLAIVTAIGKRILHSHWLIQQQHIGKSQLRETERILAAAAASGLLSERMAWICGLKSHQCVLLIFGVKTQVGHFCYLQTLC